jgi:hypothetical protein
MDSNPSQKSWNVLCWNIRRINAEVKWDSIRNKILESKCDIVSIKETKRETFDPSYIKKFCPTCFHGFCFLPLAGASGGILVAWKSSVFSRAQIFQNSFALLVEFTYVWSNDSWILTSVYGPCDSLGKETFMNWFENIEMPDDVSWLILGDINMYRRPKNRNKSGANFVDMLLFNNVISALGIV